MVGRAALGNPWVFEQINDIVAGRDPREIGIEERFAVMQQHVDLEIADFPELIGVKEMRKHLSFYFRGLREATTYRGRINQITTAAELKGLLNEYHDVCMNAGEEVCHEER
jgi:tRNA-dihydrouridine synthase B